MIATVPLPPPPPKPCCTLKRRRIAANVNIKDASWVDSLSTLLYVSSLHQIYQNKIKAPLSPSLTVEDCRQALMQGRSREATVGSGSALNFDLMQLGRSAEVSSSQKRKMK